MQMQNARIAVSNLELASEHSIPKCHYLEAELIPLNESHPRHSYDHMKFRAKLDKRYPQIY
jgi:hypothetical protein